MKFDREDGDGAGLAPVMKSGSDTIPRAVWKVAAVVVAGAFTSQLDTSVVNIGLNTIGKDLGASLAQVQWVSNSYLVALAVGLPVAGWLGRKLGVGRLWLVSLGLFTVSSGLCALAPGIGSLIVLRVLQGLTAGLLVPAGQTILGQAVGPRRLGRMMGTLGLAVSLAPALGPVVGGIVIDALSWQWLFLINLPIGIVGLMFGLRLIPRGEPGKALRFDWPGFALISVGLPLVVYGLTATGQHGSLDTPSALVPLVIGALALVGFASRAIRTKFPLLDLGLYRDRIYTAASGAVAFTGAAMFGASLLYPLYFQLLRGQSPFETGVSMIVYGLGTAVTVPFAGVITDRFGGGAVAVVGNALTIVATVPFALIHQSVDPVAIQALLFLRGVAIGVAAVPAGVAAYAAVSPKQLPDATTQVNILQRLGGAVGGALFVVILTHGLSGNATQAFHTAFWCLSGSSILALGTALWLARAARVDRPADRKSKQRVQPTARDSDVGHELKLPLTSSPRRTK
jgi:EmrB/QacA subfamily drug resistance transporter